MKKILVTGGAGFIGVHLTDALIKKKYKILVVDNLKTIGGIKYIHPKSYFLRGDLLSNKILKKIEMWKPEIIFHLAAQSAGESAYDNPKYDFLSNGFGTYKLCELAKKIKIKHLIYTSSVAVYGSSKKQKMSENNDINPDSIYGVSKYTGEMFIKQLLKATKIKTTIFRVFNTYGPGENLNYTKKGMVSIFSSYIWKKKPIIVKGSLNRVRDITYIKDCIKILTESINNNRLKKNDIINLSSGQRFTVKELIKQILLASGKKKYEIIIKSGTPGDSAVFHASNKKLKKRFPNIKFTSIKLGLKEYFNWINKVPINKNLKNYHPLKIKRMIAQTEK